jgi:hypothetical protein
MSRAPICTSYVPAEEINSAQPWYAGKVERSLCDAVVADANQGDFLVRESASSGGMVLVVHDEGKV